MKIKFRRVGTCSIPGFIKIYFAINSMDRTNISTIISKYLTKNNNSIEDLISQHSQHNY